MSYGPPILPALRRLCVVLGAMIGVPAAATGLSGIAEPPQEGALALGPPAGPAAGANPYGTIEIDRAIRPVAGQERSPSASFDRLRDGYFRQMLSAGPFETDVARPADPRPTQLPIGCEPLGGAASDLAQIPGLCLS